VFRQSGAAVTSQIFDARTHVVSEEEIAALRDMLQRLIAAKSPAPAARAGRPGMIH
jgi:hypothetical protein